MRHTLKVLLLSFMATAILATNVFAEWVYVTKNGKKYHHETSRFAKMESSQKLSKEEAEELGYEPSKQYLRLEAETDEKKAN